MNIERIKLDISVAEANGDLHALVDSYKEVLSNINIMRRKFSLTASLQRTNAVKQALEAAIDRLQGVKQ